MTSANVSNNLVMLKGITQGKTEDLVAKSSEGFMDVMNKSMMPDVSLKANVVNTSTSDYSKSDSDYKSIENKNLANPSKVTPKEMDKDAKEAVEEFSKDVKGAIEEALDVSEEDIEKAMEVLQLTPVDLLNPGNITLLITQLTGSDDVSLIMDENISNLISGLNDLVTQLLDETQKTIPEIKDILSEMIEIAPEDDISNLLEKVDTSILNEIPMEEGQTIPEVDNQPAWTYQEKPDMEIPMEKLDDVEDVKPLENVALKPVEVVDTTEETTQSVVDVTSEVVVNEFENEFEGNSNNSQNDMTKKWVDQILSNKDTDNSNAVNFTQHVSGEEITASTVSETVETPHISQAETIDIINQIAEQARVSISQDSSSMEMILNPEHLGRIYMEVTNENGNIHAKLVTENPAVKEALETQIQLVKDSLTNTAAKVTEVEVSVGTHEFERNLEDDAKRQQRQAEEMEANRPRRRSLNLNNLDELSGLMSEEEVLVAQMMREQGNTMNIEA